MTGGSDAPEILWQPTQEFIESTNLAHYMAWLHRTRGLSFEGYAQLHQWSVERIEDFWESLFQYFEIESETPYSSVLSSRDMPGAHWFPGAEVNFARHVLRNADADRDRPAIIHQSEGSVLRSLNWGDLEDKVFRLAAFLRSHGIGSGDVVAAYITNVPEAIIAFLATAAIGAVWSTCSPEFGSQAVRSRFEQMSPKVLFAVDGYRFGGKHHDRSQEILGLIAEFRSLQLVVHLPSAAWTKEESIAPGAASWGEALASEAIGLEYAPTAFEHPLFVCFSSGTTGIPKAIVHGHGGVTLEMLKLHVLQENAGRESRTFFYSTTGWIVWVSSVVSGLISGGSVVTYDGNPLFPDPDSLWRLAATSRATSFGASPAYMTAIADSGMIPGERFDLSAIETVLMTGSPASPEITTWAKRSIAVGARVGNLSGGTDLCTAIVGVCPVLPAYAGEFQCAQLGVDAVAFTDEGKPAGEAVGELVIRQPMPTMPLYFLNDPDGARLRESYYDLFPGIWRQGDFFRVTDRGTSQILGRSDATLNRNGIRIGTAEIYRILENIPEIADSLVINLELPQGRSLMPLFIQLADDAVLTQALEKVIREKLRADGSPRHVPDRILACPAVPYTISGKKLEVPVKRILLGTMTEAAANLGAMRNPESLTYFQTLQLI